MAEDFPDFFSRDVLQIAARFVEKTNRIITFEGDDDRLEAALFAAMYRLDGAAAGGGVVYAGVFLVGEQQLPGFDPVARLHREGGFHADIVVSEQGDPGDRCPRPDCLIGFSHDRDVQPFLDRNMFHIKENSSRCAPDGPGNSGRNVRLWTIFLRYGQNAYIIVFTWN